LKSKIQNPKSKIQPGQCATLACLLEVTAPKPGNVHRGCDFEDMTFLDFAVSAAAIGPAMQAAPRQGVGETVLQAIHATRRLVDVNTNLGTVLLLAPLAAVPQGQTLQAGVARVLDDMTESDADRVYRAIRLAQPGGLGRVEQMDVAEQPPADLRLAMRAAAERDLVARQYAEGFDLVLNFVAPSLSAGPAAGWSLTQTIIHTQMRVLAAYPDSLIARKCGAAVAQRAAEMAAAVLAAGQPGDEDYLRLLGDLDFWLRCDGHRRNPGTTADLIAAGLFAALREGRLAPPFR
jgi:triphosphoribosyl-dephospho-CoA synthase